MALIRDRYEAAMYDIMTKCNIVPSERDHNIPADASFEHVLQYTEWHMGYLNRDAAIRMLGNTTATIDIDAFWSL